MRHLFTGLGLATAALLVSAAPAAAESPQARQPARVDSNTQERTICMRVELSNSRIVRRVCRTESEWRARGELDDDIR
jgi:hypothetical protein